MKTDSFFDVLPADMQAHAIAQATQLIVAAAEAGVDASEIARLAAHVKERAEALTDYLDPCNMAGGVPPLYPDALPEVALADRYGTNVVAFRPRK